MDIVSTVSVIVGSVILLGLFVIPNIKAEKEATNQEGI